MSKIEDEEKINIIRISRSCVFFLLQSQIEIGMNSRLIIRDQPTRLIRRPRRDHFNEQVLFSQLAKPI